MGFINLKEMAKRAKMTEEEIMELVEIGVIKPQKSYCHPADFGDGREIAFIPEEALADIKEAAKDKPALKDPFEEPVPEEPEVEPEGEGEEKAEPEPEALKAEELAKKKAEEKMMVAAEKKKGKK